MTDPTSITRDQVRAAYDALGLDPDAWDDTFELLIDRGWVVVKRRACPIAVIAVRDGREPPARRDPHKAGPRGVCVGCGSPRWVGWRAGPAHEGFPLGRQCVPCGAVRDVGAVPDE